MKPTLILIRQLYIYVYVFSDMEMHVLEQKEAAIPGSNLYSKQYVLNLIIFFSFSCHYCLYCKWLSAFHVLFYDNKKPVLPNHFKRIIY
jgi:hypothetical protein